MSQTRIDPQTQGQPWNERGTVVVPPDRELLPETGQGSGEADPAQPIVTESPPAAEPPPSAEREAELVATSVPPPDRAPAQSSATATDSPIDGAGEASATPLFDASVADELRGRWTDVQVGFVDEPRRAVEQADALVADVLGRLTDGFTAERQSLEQQWSRGDGVSTEDLRMALRRYRSFFDRLLSI